MKKLTAIAAVLACAATALGPAPTGSTTAAPTTASATQQAPNPQPANLPAEQTPFVISERYDPDGGIMYRYSGMPPKEWGQYLQIRGLQVWTKSTGRKSSKTKTKTDACKTA